MDTKPTAPQERGSHTSASSALADQLCPGRHLYQIGMPDKKSEDSIKGDRVHAALCKGVPDGLDIEERELYDRTQAIEQELLTRYYGPEISSLKAFPTREKRQWISWTQAGGLQHSGQADAVFRYKSRALVVDYKTGRDEVPESPTNMQMRDLAVLNWVNMPLLTEIAVVIIQPWVTSKPEICAYKVDDIKKSVTNMLARVQASNNPDAPRVAGEAQCKYCRAKSKCAEYQKFAASMIPVGDRSIVDNPVANWTPDQCAIFLNGMGRAEKWLAECKSAMKEQLAAGAKIPGWELKPGMKRESITDAETVFTRFNELGGTVPQFMDCITVGKTKLKEQLAAVTKTKGKALDAKLASLTEGCVETKETEQQLKKVEV